MAPIPSPILYNPQSFSGVTPGDLAQFNQSVQQGSIPNILGDSILGAQFNTSTWSPAQAGTTAFLQGLFGAGLKQYAKNDAASQLAAIRPLLPQLSMNPSVVAIPSGVDEAAFNALRNTAISNNAVQQAEMNAAIQKLGAQQEAAMEKTAFGRPNIQGLWNRYAQKRGLDPNALTAITPGAAPAATPVVPTVRAPAGAYTSEPYFNAAPVEGSVMEESVPPPIMASTAPAVKFPTEVVQPVTQAPAMPTRSLGTVGGGARQNIKDRLMSDWGDKIATGVFEYGASPSDSAAQATKLQTAELDALNRQTAAMSESLNAGAKVRDLAGKYRVALDKAGNTGFGGQLLQTGAGLASWFNGDQAAKYAGGQQVESLSSEGIALTGRAFKGPMSNKDVQIMLRAYPSLTNDESANAEILARWDYAAALQDQYAKFIYDRQAEGIDPIRADIAWNEISMANPYAIKGPDGKLQPNQAWLNDTLAIPGSVEQILYTDAPLSGLMGGVQPTAQAGGFEIRVDPKTGQKYKVLLGQ
jgi:hypothetical protein